MIRSGASLPSDVSGMSMLSTEHDEQYFFIPSSNVWPTCARIWNAEMLTYSTSALPPLSLTTSAAR